SGLPSPRILNVTEPEFYQQLEVELKTRPLADWKTYLRWHLVHDRARFLGRKFADENFAFFSKYLRGLEQRPPRWKQCVRWTDQNLGEALGQVFVAKTFSASVKQRTVAMTKEIELAMEGEIRQLSWMSDATKKRALEKLHLVVN